MSIIDPNVLMLLSYMFIKAHFSFNPNYFFRDNIVFDPYVKDQVFRFQSCHTKRLNNFLKPGIAQ